jgi:hypothetical protein
MTSARGGLAALVLGHVAACQAPTEVTLAITTNVDCAEVQGTAIVVGKNGKDVDGRDPATITQACTRGRIGTVVLLPGASRDGSFAVKLVAAVGEGVLPEDCLAGTVTSVKKGLRGCIVARRELSFIPHEPLDLPIALHRACIGVVCGEEETCVEDGSCQSAVIGNPTSCAGPGGCNESSLGNGGASGGTGTSGTISPSSGTTGTGGTGSTATLTGTTATLTGVGGAVTSTGTGSGGSGNTGGTGTSSTSTSSSSTLTSNSSTTTSSSSSSSSTTTSSSSTTTTTTSSSTTTTTTTTTSSSTTTSNTMITTTPTGATTATF